MILELDQQLIETLRIRLGAVVADVAFPLQDLEHIVAQLRGRSRDLCFAGPLAIADPGQHIPEGIAHRHAVLLLTSSPWSCRGSARWRRAPAGRYATSAVCDSSHAAGLSWRSDCAACSSPNCAAARPTSDRPESALLAAARDSSLSP